MGLLYSAFTNYLGFKVNSGEYKVMGLAPYGKPIYYKKILENLIDVKEDGSFFLDQSYFDYATGYKMISKKFEELFKKKSRYSNENISQFHMDIAASIQKVTEHVVVNICKNLFNEYKIENLCLAGGVALNCVANGKILKNTKFKNLWIQPAAGDAGGSLGAALAYWYIVLKKNRVIQINDSMKGSYLGSQFSNDEIENKLKFLDANFKKLPKNELISLTASRLSEGKCIGWFQGRMEFGPRALGNRSIIADPRNYRMQEILNLKIKFRESFRPFAPAILEEYLNDYYEKGNISPYMLLVDYLKTNKRTAINEIEFKKKEGIEKLKFQRSEVPSVTHLDFSSRIQTVNSIYNKKFYDLIKSFYNLTSCPMIINTSFNIRGEPIVESIEDAYNCFVGTNLDILVCGDFFLEKKDQKVKFNDKYKERFELD